MRPLVTTESPKVLKSAEKKEAVVDLNNLYEKVDEICLKSYRESEEEYFNDPLQQNVIQDKYRT